MPELSTRQLMRRHVTPFMVTLGSLTTFLLARSAARLWPQVSAREDASATLLEALLLAMPSAVALTIPMAVFIAVAWVFATLGRDGVLAAAERERHGIRRLIRPVVGVATLIAALALVSNAELLPRANERFAALFAEGPVAQSDRAMTLSELRAAATNTRARGGADAAARAAAFEVEIQKKFALAAACLFLALAAAAIVVRFPRGGRALVLVAGTAVFTAYYASVVVGEALADLQVIPPVVAMWMANIMLLAVAVLLLWRRGGASGRPLETLPCDV